jgi:plasmid stabilization system protein ParE
MNKVIFSPEAVEDLEDIWLYIAQDSLDRADNFIDALRNFCIEDLTLFPKIGSGYKKRVTSPISISCDTISVVS